MKHRHHRRSLGQAFAPIEAPSPPRRRWIWVLAAGLVGGGIILGVRMALAAKNEQPSSPTNATPYQNTTGRKPKLLILGDSITAGYLPKLKSMLKGQAEVTGEGFGGRMVAYIHEHGQRYFARDITHVVILAGINNIASYDAGYRAVVANKDVHNVGKALAKFWVDAKRAMPQARLIALTLLPCPAHRLCKRPEIATEREKLNAYIRQSRGVEGGPDVVIDTDGFPTDLLGGDGLHPSGSGQTYLAQMVAQAL